MNSFFSIENPIFGFLSRIWDIFVLNLLCILCCIPIVTSGASVTALYYCMLKIVRKKDTSVTKMFFDSFRMNLKQGVTLTFYIIGTLIFLMLDLYACNVLEYSFFKYWKVFLYVMIAFLLMIESYIFPILAQFENSNQEVLRNAFYMCFGYFPKTLMISALNAVPVILFFFFPELFVLTIPFWLLLGFAMIAMLNSKLFVKIFEKETRER